MVTKMHAERDEAGSRAGHSTPMDSSRSQTAVNTALRSLARRAVGRSGADIERLVRDARRAARRTGRPLTWSDIESAIEAGRVGMPRELRWRMAVHEAGHALVQLVVGDGQITLISIEASHGGFVRIEDERYPLQT